MKTVHDFFRKKIEKQKITMVTSYDAWSARLVNQSEVDCILVGDSVSMVVHGFDSTLHATPQMMADHVAAVARGAKEKFIVGDMPFLSFRKGIREAMNCVELLMKAGAHAVKLEGVRGHEEVVRSIVEAGVPVMGHLGLTPQSIHQMGGYKVQGRGQSEADQMIADAELLQELGCFSLVLECVPKKLADQITARLKIPTIGIGAGVGCDGQVLVLQDLLGLESRFKPKFLRRYLDGSEQVIAGLNRFHSDVVEQKFPSEEESYTGG